MNKEDFAYFMYYKAVQKENAGKGKGKMWVRYAYGKRKKVVLWEGF